MFYKNNESQNMEKIKLVLVSFLFISIALTPMILNQSTQAGGGLKVNVHINSAGQICVSSPDQDLGCKSSNGPGVVQFQFDSDVVEEGDTFQACFKGSCVTGTNGPESAPEDVYLLSATSTGSNNAVNEEPQRTDKDIEKTISTSNPDLSITSVSDYYTGNYFYIVGEVLNKAPIEKTFVKVTATFYDDAKQVIGTSYVYTNPTTILPSDSAPFKLMIGSTDVSNINFINSYKLVVSSS
jgi:hypothetical protein